MTPHTLDSAITDTDKIEIPDIDSDLVGYKPDDPQNRAFWVNWLFKDLSETLDRARADGLPDELPAIAVIEALLMTVSKVIEARGNELCEQEIFEVFHELCANKVFHISPESTLPEILTDIPF